jgi:hypothetical protein
MAYVEKDKAYSDYKYILKMINKDGSKDPNFVEIEYDFILKPPQKEVTYQYLPLDNLPKLSNGNVFKMDEFF